MKTATGIALIVLVASVGLGGTLWGLRRLAGRVMAFRRRRAPWRCLERPLTGEGLGFYVFRPGDPPQLIGVVPFAHENFNGVVEEMRAHVREILVGLNSGRDEAWL